MQLGMIGLGRMGANLVRRCSRAGIECVAYDRSSEAVQELVDEGVAIGADSVEDLVSKLDGPRAVWVMVPAAVAGDVVMDVAQYLEADDVVIDGGNSHYPLDIARADELNPRGIHYLDVGTSGGVFGLERGYCLMIGGPDEPVARLDPIWKALAPGVEAAERTRGKDADPEQAEYGYLHCGPVGAGHFVKMVHNGIEATRSSPPCGPSSAATKKPRRTLSKTDAGSHNPEGRQAHTRRLPCHVRHHW